MDPAIFLALAIAYLLGSIPTGPWLGRLAGIDVQKQGSGNSGAANVARTVGKLAGIATLIGDSFKGLLAVGIARLLVDDAWVGGAAGLAAVFGHSFSIFLKLSGGKGVATAFGVFLALAPAAAALSVALFVLVAFTTKYVSLASIVAAASLPLATYLAAYPGFVTAVGLTTACFVVLRHRDNLRRLANGTEPRLASKPGKAGLPQGR